MKDFHILVIRPGAIGDVLLAFPVLKALKERYANAHITLVSNAQVLPLALASGVAEKVSDFQDTLWSELFSSSGIHTPALAGLLDHTDLAICWLRDADGIVKRNINAAGVKRLVIAPGRPHPGTDMHILDYLAQTIGLPPVGARLWRLPNDAGNHGGVGARFIAPWGGEGIPHAPMNLTTGIFSPLSLWPTNPDLKETPEQYVAIHPGSGGAQKCWKVSHFAGAIDRKSVV